MTRPGYLRLAEAGEAHPHFELASPAEAQAHAMKARETAK
jgi:hypothetical protein